MSARGKKEGKEIKKKQGKQGLKLEILTRLALTENQRLI